MQERNMEITKKKLSFSSNSSVQAQTA